VVHSCDARESPLRRSEERSTRITRTNELIARWYPLMKRGNSFTFLILALLGAFVPLGALAPFVYAHGFAPGLFVKQLFETPVSRFFAFDVLFSAITFWVFMLREGRRLEMKKIWVYVLCTCLVGVSLGLPLFLLFRERKMS